MPTLLGGCFSVPDPYIDGAYVHFKNGCAEPIFAGLDVYPDGLEGFSIPSTYTAVQPGETSDSYSEFDRDTYNEVYFLWVVPEGATTWDGPNFEVSPDLVVPTGHGGEYVLEVQGDWCPQL